MPVLTKTFEILTYITTGVAFFQLLNSKIFEGNFMNRDEIINSLRRFREKIIQNITS